ncbi:hypothetical protein OGAPHI_005653 [Ogataea philodendri]|uniref:Uncharacterized protein n=1 Tax=Ogataea philodendri TaxID=1378263 RepID=A0A9P8T1C7_9ASCO|nr:uncharacterized protein OGAPHI_005653 [Ogataea philodendri]KAH3662401.1 hypothetical protein OGAPHI_005653 [Ogataea philodendri]
MMDSPTILEITILDSSIFFSCSLPAGVSMYSSDTSIREEAPMSFWINSPASSRQWLMESTTILVSLANDSLSRSPSISIMCGFFCFFNGSVDDDDLVETLRVQNESQSDMPLSLSSHTETHQCFLGFTNRPDRKSFNQGQGGTESCSERRESGSVENSNWEPDLLVQNRGYSGKSLFGPGKSLHSNGLTGGSHEEVRGIRRGGNDSRRN